MRKQKKILLTIDLIVFIVSMSIGLGFGYSDKMSYTDSLSKYGFFIGIPAVISFSVMMWYVVKIMIGKK